MVIVDREWSQHSDREEEQMGLWAALTRGSKGGPKSPDSPSPVCAISHRADVRNHCDRRVPFRS